MVLFLCCFRRTIVNQDKLGSRKKCEVRARKVLQQGGRVAIDRYRTQKLYYENVTKSSSTSLAKPIKLVTVSPFAGRVLLTLGVHSAGLLVPVVCVSYV